MDIIRFSGGLGNQMFQYAFMEALKSKGRDVRASLGFYNKHSEAMPFSLCTVFPEIELEYVSDSEFDLIDRKWKDMKEKGIEKSFFNNCSERFFWVENIAEEPGTYHPEVFLTKNCTFVGYWQTEKYFKDIRTNLIKKFRFETNRSALKDFAEKLSDEAYVSVHVRRGDYLTYADSYMGICTQGYYQKAIAYIKSKERNTKFIFFSDDMDWVKKNIYISEAIYCERQMFGDYEDWFDMYLMTICRHNILANSSFSWWGAWLNQNEEKIVIAPDRWLLYSDTPDVWCNGWIKL